jgi:hypothetical protein
MIWLALPLTAWACVAAYGIWAARSVHLAKIAEKRDERAHEVAAQERTDKAFDRMQGLIQQWSAARETAPSPAVPDGLNFPARGDNFTTLLDASVLRPEFGKKPRTDSQPDGVA